MNIRQANTADSSRLLQIYRPIVENTTTSFELVAPNEEQFAKRISSAIASHDWLVMEDGEELCGYAYATTHRAREAYKHAVETSVYVNSNYQRSGVGKKLYEALFESLQSRVFHNAYAGIALPNAPSLALHESVGFEPIGVFRDIGYKHGAWHDVSWWQRAI